MQAGVVLNPSTPIGAIEEVASEVDFVLLMSVNPGFGGQRFIRGSLDKIRRMRALLDRAGSHAPIEVDGGVDLQHHQRRRGRGGQHSRGWQRGLWCRRSRCQPGRAATGGGSVKPSPASPPVRCAAPVVRVRYAETDRMGVVYYANYLVWFEVGRTEWLREAGWTYRAMEDEGLSLPVIEAQCAYKLSAALRR